MSAPTFGSQEPGVVSQCVLLPFPTVLTHISAFFIMKVPVRKMLPWPETVACADGELEMVALPSMKTVPRTVSLFAELSHDSSPALDVHEYDWFGVKSMAA